MSALFASDAAQALVREVLDAIAEASPPPGTPSPPVKPDHRHPFQWPPHPVSFDFHVLPHQFTGRTEVAIDDEIFEVEVATTPYGWFGRCRALWLEARGENEQDLLEALRRSAEPLITRQRTISRTLGLEGRFKGSLRELTDGQWLRLLYCPDRSIAHDAAGLIETSARTTLFAPALITILRDERHPHRRSAQWEVLDLFEDLPPFCPGPAEQAEAISAIRDLIWRAEDDYARTIFKAGTVLGGHICTDPAADALLECLRAPHKIGRRSAIHAVFHLAEWMPERKSQIVEALWEVARHDPEPSLRLFAESMARDVAAGEVDHMMEPVFEDEP